jgi:hypothetical protein
LKLEQATTWKHRNKMPIKEMYGRTASNKTKEENPLRERLKSKKGPSWTEQQSDEN